MSILKKKPKSVGAIWAAGLCIGCGTCASACPKGAVSIKRHSWKGFYFPEIDQRLCNQCGYCLQACPGGSVNFQHLATEFLDGQSSDKLIGTFSQLYIGHASSFKIRYNASSGGLVTSLLCYALEHKIIDGALVLTMSESNPLETEPRIATTPDEIMAAAGSKYCPAAPNVKLREILAMPGRYALVGLPCHVHAVRKWQLIMPDLRSKIAFICGLFCANSSTYLGTEYFLKSHGIDPRLVSEIRYRGEGWPGKIKVALRDGTIKFFPRPASEKSWHRRALLISAFHYDFIHPRCLLCPDQTAELADISFGDPWLPEYTQVERLGKSLIIVRTRVGSELVNAALRDGAIVAEPVELNVVKRAQNYSFKQGVGSRLKLRALIGLSVPDYGKRELRVSLGSCWGLLYYLPSFISHQRILWPLIRVLALFRYRLMSAIRFGKRVTRFLLRIMFRRQRSGQIAETHHQLSVEPVFKEGNAGPKILLIGAPISRNFGGPSLLEATRLVLGRVLPGARYVFISPLIEDLPLADQYDVKIIHAVPIKNLILGALIRKFLGRLIGTLEVQRVLKAYEEADLVIDVWGIGFSDTLSKGSFRSCLFSGGRFLVGKILGKPVIKYTADLGPFETRWNRFFSRLYFNHTVDLILARSEITKERLVTLRIKTPIIVCPDTAFMLPAKTSFFSLKLAEERADRPIVGFSVSHMSSRQAGDEERYIKLMAGLADHILEVTGGKLLFLPNELSFDLALDDRHFTHMVIEKMTRQDQVMVAPVESLTAQELKGVIAQCEVVVASRYHTIVAALSQAIPVLAIGWHAKYEGVMDLVGQGEFVCQVRFMSADELQIKFDRLWASRDEARANIKSALPCIEEKIMHGAIRVANLVAPRGMSYLNI
ncbi:MAG: Coenzyme F420 hydrogenase/dehydrogenase, beta subunit C-terminal domain [Thermoproteota archaeon]